MESWSHLPYRLDSKGPPMFLLFLAEAAQAAEKTPHSVPLCCQSLTRRIMP